MPNPETQDPVREIAAIYAVYTALIGTEISLSNSLGGELLYAGTIDSQSRRLLIAANIAGAASLAVSPDPLALRQAMRDGVIDFLVNSLEEALRILKNEIRKHQTVAVGVSANPHDFVAAMLHRGVLPDLLNKESNPAEPSAVQTFLAQGAKQISTASPVEPQKITTWSVNAQPVRWLPRLDQCAKATLPSDDELRQRWLRLAPRYLGRIAQRHHGIVMDESELTNFRASVEVLKQNHASEQEESVEITILNAAVLPPESLFA